MLNINIFCQYLCFIKILVLSIWSIAIWDSNDPFTIDNKSLALSSSFSSNSLRIFSSRVIASLIPPSGNTLKWISVDCYPTALQITPASFLSQLGLTWTNIPVYRIACPQPNRTIYKVLKKMLIRGTIPIIKIKSYFLWCPSKRKLEVFATKPIISWKVFVYHCFSSQIELTICLY